MPLERRRGGPRGAGGAGGRRGGARGRGAGGKALPDIQVTESGSRETLPAAEGDEAAVEAQPPERVEAEGESCWTFGPFMKPKGAVKITDVLALPSSSLGVPPRSPRKVKRLALQSGPGKREVAAASDGSNTAKEDDSQSEHSRVSGGTARSRLREWEATPFTQRQIEWMKQKEERIEEMRRQLLAEEAKHFTFKPQLVSSTIDSLMSMDARLWRIRMHLRNISSFASRYNRGQAGQTRNWTDADGLQEVRRQKQIDQRNLRDILHVCHTANALSQTPRRFKAPPRLSSTQRLSMSSMSNLAPGSPKPSSPKPSSRGHVLIEQLELEAYTLFTTKELHGVLDKIPLSRSLKGPMGTSTHLTERETLELLRKCGVRERFVMDRLYPMLCMEGYGAKVELRDIVLALSVILRGESEDKKHFWFTVFDVGYKGYITWEDAFRVLGGSTSTNPDDVVARVSRLVTALDRDKDNVISQEEFLGADDDSAALVYCDLEAQFRDYFDVGALDPDAFGGGLDEGNV